LRSITVSLEQLLTCQLTGCARPNAGTDV